MFHSDCFNDENSENLENLENSEPAPLTPGRFPSDAVSVQEHVDARVRRVRRHRALSRRRFLIWTGLTTLTSVSALASGCGGGRSSTVIAGPIGPTPGPGSNDIVLRPDVAVIPDDGSVVVGAVTSTSVALSGAIAALTVGTVIVSGIGDGFLRRITGIAPAGPGAVVAQTRNATLAEVFERAEFRIRKTYAPGEIDLTKAQILDPAVSLQPAPPEPPAGRQEFNETIAETLLVPFNKMQISSGDDEAGAAVEVDGQVTFGILLDWTFRYDALGLAEATIVAAASHQMALTLSLKGKGIFVAREKDYLPIPLPRFTFTAGPVPIVITPELILSASVEGSGEIGLGVTGTLGLAGAGGMRFRRGEAPAPLGSFSASGSPVPQLNLFTSVAFEFAPMNVRVEFLIYGLAGPFIKLKTCAVKAELKASPTSGEVEFGINAVFGASAGIAEGDLLGMLLDGIDTGFEVQFAEVEKPLIDPTVFKAGQGSVTVS